jgi:pyrroline-5-carboxylate reductase
MTHVVMIGAGNLTKTFALGWADHLFALEMRLSVLTRSLQYQERGWIKGLPTPTLEAAVLTDADVVILAVKPKDLDVAVAQVRAYAPKTCLVVSVLAGVSLETLATALPGYTVLRTMPNVAVAAGQGIVAVAQSPALAHPGWPWFFHALGQIGHVLTLPEVLMDAATAISGSGPAYVYLIMQALTEAGTAFGIADDVARDLAVRTVRGAAEVALAHPNESFDDLIRWVASPGGTTQAALEVLRRTRVAENLSDAIFEAQARASGLNPARPSEA